MLLVPVAAFQEMDLLAQLLYIVEAGSAKLLYWLELAAR